MHSIQEKLREAAKKTTEALREFSGVGVDDRTFLPKKVLREMEELDAKSRSLYDGIDKGLGVIAEMKKTLDLQKADAHGA